MTISSRTYMFLNYWKITIISIFVTLLSRTTAAGLLNTIQNPILASPSMSNSFQETTANSGVGIPCYIEYQVTKQKAGRCVKLGRDLRGCLADSYINPFHPDCS